MRNILRKRTCLLNELKEQFKTSKQIGQYKLRMEDLSKKVSDLYAKTRNCKDI